MKDFVESRKRAQRDKNLGLTRRKRETHRSTKKGKCIVYFTSVREEEGSDGVFFNYGDNLVLTLK